MKIELLSPAGSKEKLETAFLYGADACYFSGKRFGLRAFANNFTDDDLEKGIIYAHSIDKKCYITVNILAHNKDFDGLKEYLQYLEKIHADGVIVADIGIMKFVKDYAPGLEIHVSTQANITNKYAAMEFINNGAKRLVLARELSIDEIREIHDYIPKDIEIECFVHGAMCISYSGRCLLSNYFCGRDSNGGQCIQACRFEYALMEKTRHNEYFPVQEDEHGTYILNSKDLCMIEYLPELIDAGVTSFKIEGRMKSPYYVATVTNAYRRAIKLYENYKNNILSLEKYYLEIKELKVELEKTSHRRFTTGFYFGADDKEYLKESLPIQSHEFMAIVLENSNDGYAIIEQRNRFKIGDEFEILSPTDSFNKNIIVEKMTDLSDIEIEDATLVQQHIKLYSNTSLKIGDILRKKID